MTGPKRPRHVLRAGMKLTLDEIEYKFGVGTITIEVERILERLVLRDGVWVRVRGLVRRADTDPGAVREVYIIETALPVE